MEYRRLGSSGLLASNVVLGTQDFGVYVSEEESFKILDKAVELGVNFIDTANSYGIRGGKFGTSETVIGNWLELHPENRKKVIINTKCFTKLGDESYGINDREGISYSKMMLQLEDSLKRLKTSYVDIYTIHFEPTGEFITEMWDAFDTMKKQGTVHYAGASNFSVYGLVRAQEEARNRHMMGFVTEQNQYNICRRLVEMEMIPALRRENISQLCWGPLYGGRLTRKVFSNDKTGRQISNPMSEQLIAKLKRFQALCEEYELVEEEVALAWLFNRPNPCFVITGPNSTEELESCVRSSEMKLPQGLLDGIDEIFTGFEEAPAVYATMNKADLA